MCPGKIPAELQRSDTERLVERKNEAERVAREAALRAEVVALLKARALLEQVGDDVDREQRRDETHRQHDHAG